MGTGLIAYLALNTLLVALGAPLFLRRVKPNLLHGVRIPETLADDVVWYEVNARWGRDIAIVGLVGLALSVGLYLWPAISERAYHSIMMAYLVSGALLTFLLDLRYARRLAARRQRDEPEGQGVG